MTEITQTTVGANSVYIIDDVNNTLVVDATRTRVGIGTTNPGYALAVTGDIHATGLVQGVNLIITAGGGGNLTFADGTTQATAGAPGTMSSWVISDAGGNVQPITNGNVVVVSGGTGLTSTVTPGIAGVDIVLDNTAVTPATYGDATNVAQFTVDAQGRLTAAAAVAITYPAKAQFTLTADSGSNQTIADGNTMDIAGGTGLSSVVGATDTVTLNLDNTAVTAGSYTRASLTVDAQGRLTAASSGAAPDISGTIAAGQIAYGASADTIEGTNNLYFDDSNVRMSIGGDTSPDAMLHLISATSAQPEIRLENTNADEQEACIRFMKNTASPASGDDIGLIRFEGENSAGGNHLYSYIMAQILDPTDTQESGEMIFYVGHKGSQLRVFEITGSNTGDGEVVVNEGGNDDFNFRVETNTITNALFVDAGNDAIEINGTLNMGSNLTHYNNTAPVAGQLLIGDATAGVWDAATLTAGSNVTITNADGAITIAASGGGGGGSPGGANTQVQFNNSGSFGGSANFTFDGTNIAVSNNVVAGARIIGNTVESQTVAAGQYALVTTSNHVWPGAPVGTSATVMPAVDLTAGNYDFLTLGGAGNCSQTHYIMVTVGDRNNQIDMPDPGIAGLPPGSRWTFNFGDPAGNSQKIQFVSPLNTAYTLIEARTIGAVTIFTDGVAWYVESMVDTSGAGLIVFS